MAEAIMHAYGGRAILQLESAILQVSNWRAVHIMDRLKMEKRRLVIFPETKVEEVKP